MICIHGYMHIRTVLASLAFFEEFLPGTDLFPTATVSWTFEHVPGLTQLGWLAGIRKDKDVSKPADKK
jgi:hypothetical protein